jgi:multiple sugar transport system substrate-binding protein
MKDRKKLSRRDFLRLGALTAAGAVLANCSPATETEEPAEGEPAAPPEPEGPVATWWWSWGNLAPAVDEIVATDEFQEWMGPDTLEYKGNVDSDALLTAVAAGTPPDGGSNFDYPNLWSRQAVLPVNEWVDASDHIDGDDVLEGLWDSSFYGPDMIGVPGIEGFLWYGLNYNADAVEEAGLDPDNPPLTWDGCLEWHEALTEFDDGGNLLQMGLDPYDAMAGEPDLAATSWGFNWWDEENQTFNLNDPKMAQALETCGDFIRHVGPDRFLGMRQVEGQGGWGASFNAGVQNMIIEGYWHPGETEIQKPEVAEYNRATWAPVPTSREGAKIMATGAHFVQLFKDAENVETMFKVSEFLFTNTAADIIFEHVGWIFGRKSWLETVDPDTYPGLRFYIEAGQEVTDWLIGRRCPIHWFVADQYVELREAVYRDQMSGTEAAEELQKRAVDEWEAQGLDE